MMKALTKRFPSLSFINFININIFKIIFLLMGPFFILKSLYAKNPCSFSINKKTFLNSLDSMQRRVISTTHLGSGMPLLPPPIVKKNKLATLPEDFAIKSPQSTSVIKNKKENFIFFLMENYFLKQDLSPAQIPLCSLLTKKFTRHSSRKTFLQMEYFNGQQIKNIQSTNINVSSSKLPLKKVFERFIEVKQMKTVTPQIKREKKIYENILKQNYSSLCQIIKKTWGSQEKARLCSVLEQHHIGPLTWLQNNKNQMILAECKNIPTRCHNNIQNMDTPFCDRLKSDCYDNVHKNSQHFYHSSQKYMENMARKILTYNQAFHDSFYKLLEAFLSYNNETGRMIASQTKKTTLEKSFPSISLKKEVHKPLSAYGVQQIKINIHHPKQNMTLSGFIFSEKSQILSCHLNAEQTITQHNKKTRPLLPLQAHFITLDTSRKNKEPQFQCKSYQHFMLDSLKWSQQMASGLTKTERAAIDNKIKNYNVINPHWNIKTHKLLTWMVNFVDKELTEK